MRSDPQFQFSSNFKFHSCRCGNFHFISERSIVDSLDERKIRMPKWNLSVHQFEILSGSHPNTRTLYIFRVFVGDARFTIYRRVRTDWRSLVLVVREMWRSAVHVQHLTRLSLLSVPLIARPFNKNRGTNRTRTPNTIHAIHWFQTRVGMSNHLRFFYVCCYLWLRIFAIPFAVSFYESMRCPSSTSVADIEFFLYSPHLLN